jgi:Protein of unknown function (DUF2568)
VVDRPHEIAWTGTTMGIKAVHVFRFQASDGGTLAHSEESWEGLLARLLKGYSRKTEARAPSRDGVSGLRGVTLTVRFLCELVMLAALAYWGFTVADGIGAWVLGLGAPLVAAVVWAAWVAPKARWPVPIPTRVVIELVLFGGAVGALAVAGQPVLAVVLGVAAIVSSLLNASQERQATDRPPSP